MTRLRPYLLATALLFVASAAQAQGRHQVNLPAGRLGDAVVALGRQAGVNIGLTDPALAAERVGAVSGRMSVEEALARLLRGTPARSVTVAGGTYRIVRSRARSRAASRPTPLVVASAPLPPQEEEGAEIIVTGARRPAILATYPASVEIVDGDDPELLEGLRGSEALVARLPAISSTHLGPGRNKLFIRGIADSSFNGPTQATTGQYLGETRVNYNAPDPDLRLYDIDRIEVLQGPQGTLYGAGSLGGIIRVLPNRPRTDRVEGAASFGFSWTAHGDPGADGAATINVPIVEDRVAFRAAAYAVNEGGYIDNALTGREDVNRVRTIGGRASLRFETPDGWTVDLSSTLQQIRGHDSQFADRDAPSLTRSSAIEQPFRSDYVLADLVITRDWGDTRLMTALGYVRQDLFERYDSTPPGERPQLFEQDSTITLLSAETRLSGGRPDRLNWIIGASLISNDAEQRRSAGPVDAPFALPGVDNGIQEASAFGEISVPLLPDLTISGGARLTHSRLSGESLDVALAVLQPLAGPQASRNETAFMPSLAISWTPMADLLLFARYQESYRPGGVSVSGDFIRRFRNDEVSTFEAGARFGSERLSTAVLVAYTRWNDIQADTISMNGLPTTTNIGDGRIITADIRLGWRPLPGLSLELAGVANDSVVTAPEVFFNIRSGDQLPNVADFSARIAADYRTALSRDVDLSLHASARYVGDSRLGVGPILGVEQGGWLDVGLGARLQRGRQGLSLTIDNLLDQAGNRFALGSPFTVVANPQVTPMRPLTLRLGWQLSF